MTSSITGALLVVSCRARPRPGTDPALLPVGVPQALGSGALAERAPRGCHGRATAQDRARRVRGADAVVQPRARPAEPATAAAAPGHAAAGRPGRSGPAVPDGADRAGGHHRPVRRHPRRGARRLPAVAPLAALPGAPAGEGAGHAGPDLLQVRGRLARPGRTSRTPPCRRPTTTRGRRPAADHGDRRRAVGHGAGVRLRAVRAGLRGLAGRCLLRPEALPADR